MNFIEKYWSALNGCSFSEAKSSKKYFWHCEYKKHYFVAKYSNLARTGECPYCYGSRFMRGVNDLKTFNGDIERQWSFKNLIAPEDVHHNSLKKYYFNCGEGHEYYISAKSYSSGVNCKICSGGHVGDFDSLGQIYPNISKDWNYEKNDFTPDMITSSSGRKIWWRCQRGHELHERVQLRVSKGSCSSCNSFIYSYPYLYKKYSINNSIDPLTLTTGSSKNVEWYCGDCENFHNDSVKNRVKGRGCGICAGRVIIEGFNDLASQNKELAQYYSKNNEKSSSEIFYRSNVQCEWHCEGCDYSWSEKPSRNKYCLKCSPKFRSNLEREIWMVLKEIFKGYEIKNNYAKFKEFKDVDFYLPELKLIIECNGDYWHSNKSTMGRLNIDNITYHKERSLKAEEYGLRMLYIWESDWRDDKENIINSLKEYNVNGYISQVFKRYYSKLD